LTGPSSLPSCIELAVPLAPLTSWQVGGVADYLASPKTIEELKSVLAWARAQTLEVSILSGGTNVLVSDLGVRGLVVSLRKLASLIAVEVGDRIEITALAGTSKSELLKTLLKYKLEPALFLAGLPGDIGGGVAMNAGVGEQIVPREFVELTDWIEVLRDGQLVRFAKSELQWSYRHCEGWRPGVIVRVGLSWKAAPAADLLARVKTANQVRLSKQPLDLPSCGSVFVNPQGSSSGRLIEAAGLKGYTIGGAQVSIKHANFIVNIGGATAADIHSVIEHVRSTVQAHAGVALKTEVVYLGEW
jgi:UDP-N-acetylmuramate dehydrogenase